MSWTVGALIRALQEDLGTCPFPLKLQTPEEKNPWSCFPFSAHRQNTTQGQAASTRMLSRKLAAHPRRMGDFYSCHQGRVGEESSLASQCWQSHAHKLGRGCWAAWIPAAPGNCLPCLLLGPFWLAQRHSVCPSQGTARLCHPDTRWLQQSRAQPSASLLQPGKASPLLFNLLWIQAIIIRIISSRW